MPNRKRRERQPRDGQRREAITTVAASVQPRCPLERTTHLLTTGRAAAGLDKRNSLSQSSTSVITRTPSCAEEDPPVRPAGRLRQPSSPVKTPAKECVMSGQDQAPDDGAQQRPSLDVDLGSLFDDEPWSEEEQWTWRDKQESKWTNYTQGGYAHVLGVPGDWCDGAAEGEIFNEVSDAISMCDAHVRVLVATWTKAATAARLLRKIADRLEADGDELLRDVAWRTPWGRSDDE
jgi:hypothetical protein